MIEIEKISDQVKKVIEYSQNGIDNAQVSGLTHKWYQAKYSIIQEFFNDEPMFTFPEKVTFSLDEKAQKEQYHNFLDYIGALTGYSSDLMRYLLAIPTDAFYKNSLPEDYTMSDGKKIQAGTKIVKSFKYFIEHQDLLFDIQNKASEIIQKDKIEGYLTFSVHPLDFLSSSENTFNWRSCHALDGEYRAGNLSYMLDSSTIMVYLKAEKDAKLPNFPDDVPWTNKKWRMLMHFNTGLDVVFAGRQYPFSSPGALDVVREVFYRFMVPEKYRWGEMIKDHWSYWHNDYIKDFKYSDYSNEDSEGISEDRYAVINRGIWDIEQICKDVSGSLHFNDITRSSIYLQPYYMFIKYYSPHRKLEFNIGAPVPCLKCGLAYIDDHETMMCPECHGPYCDDDEDDEYRICESCGRSIHWSDAMWVGEDLICPDCADTETFICECCGDRYYNSEKRWSEKKKVFCCTNCYLNEEEGDNENG